MINGSIDCRNCEISFILTEELWDKSFIIILDNCKNCNNETEHVIISNDLNLRILLTKCLNCQKEKANAYGY